MTWMNEHEVEDTLNRAAAHELPVALEGAMMLARLVNWTNHNSDGWPYWQKPSRAAAKLQALLHGIDRFDPVDLDRADLNRALTPIKAFLTRQGVDHSEVILPSGWAEQAINATD